MLGLACIIKIQLDTTFVDFQDAEKGRRGKRDSSGTMSTAIWSSEDADVVDDASCMAAISPPVDNDSGIDRVSF